MFVFFTSDLLDWPLDVWLSPNGASTKETKRVAQARQKIAREKFHSETLITKNEFLDTVSFACGLIIEERC